MGFLIYCKQKKSAKLKCADLPQLKLTAKKSS